ncbi:hypothetical protein [Rhizobium halophytocola]|uniref:Tfp pilus assembly protein PilO n=1 Tax=Rhizobium halophytocola TaxID=735519 RepID=A0ABS4DSR2_9HYPH|nr:hypothetical protein [Rhizobium halophytocola]MBP1848659.1 Tfp pilus assembly protein PilO [Rhizobium halophytocola]
MHANGHIFVLLTILILLTIVVIAAMKYWSASRARRDETALREELQALREEMRTGQRHAAEALAAIRQSLTSTEDKLGSIDRILRDVG